MNPTDLRQQVEAVLFISPRPLTVERLANLFEVEKNQVEEAIGAIAKEYDERKGGVMMLRQGKEVQFVTNAEAATVVQKFLKEETTGELTKPSLETLTIIAYRGPITKTELEKIRGVNCSLILRNLMIRGLIQGEEDKRRLVTFYTVTTDFLRFLGLTRTSELPDYEVLHNPEVVERLLAETDSKE